MKQLIAFFLFFVGVPSVQAVEFDHWHHEHLLPVAQMEGIEKEDWSLQYKVENGHVYVECIVPDFSLARKEKNGDGYLLVKWNGEKVAHMNKAAFMMKEVPKGKHTIEVLPVYYSGSKAKEPIRFQIEI